MWKSKTNQFLGGEEELLIKLKQTNGFEIDVSYVVRITALFDALFFGIFAL